MGLKDLTLKPFYDSDADDVLNDFYVPVLSEAVRYKRISGFFSSGSLAVAAKGMYRFIKAAGQMELVVSPRLSKEDVDAINDGTKKPDEVVAASGVRELEQVGEPFVRDHVRALAWMV